MRTIAREEVHGALAGVSERVANVEAETRAQTATLDAIKTNSDTLVKQAIESAEERGRRKAGDEERQKKATEAETRLKTWQRFAIPIGILLAIVSAFLARGHHP